MWQQLDRIREVFRQLSARHTWPFLVFAIVGYLVITLWLVVRPGAVPPVRVGGYVVSLRLGCVPASLNVLVVTGPSHLRAATLVGGERFESQSYEISSHIGDGVTDYQLVLPQTHDAHEAVSGAKFGGEGELRLVFQRAPHISLLKVVLGPAHRSERVPCTTSALTAHALLNSVNSRPAKLMRLSLIQERISDWCRALNDMVGHIVISMMTVSIVWLLAVLGRSVWQLYSRSDSEVIELTNRMMQAAPSQLVAEGRAGVLIADSARSVSRLAFARTVGPACGFALTVVALIAAMHPDVQADSDAFQFVSSLQVAMTATLVGLIIRIVAEFAIRFERENLRRMLLLTTEQAEGQSK